MGLFSRSHNKSDRQFLGDLLDGYPRLLPIEQELFYHLWNGKAYTCDMVYNIAVDDDSRYSIYVLRRREDGKHYAGWNTHTEWRQINDRLSGETFVTWPGEFMELPSDQRLDGAGIREIASRFNG